jgi:hypothetical protein
MIDRVGGDFDDAPDEVSVYAKRSEPTPGAKACWSWA